MQSPHKWMSIAWDELATAEVPGQGNNMRIVEYHQSTKLKATDDSVAWCSSFINWVMDKAGIQGSDSAAARSWLGWGEKCLPRYGALVVFSRGVSTWTGHVAFYLDEDDVNIYALGGNQHDRVCVQAFKKGQVLGYRWPT